MYNIKTINKISPVGLDKLKAKGCNVGEDIAAPDGIIVRSADMHDYEVNPELLGVARAGAGYNNIPIDELAEKGIVVFNSPGANAEAVKEQTVCSMVLASRDVVGSIEWVKSIAGQGDKIPTLVEKGKSNFAGPELMGKTVGVLGLGATGALVANACLALDMDVIGYDPFMSVEAAWRLSRDAKRADDIDPDVFDNSLSDDLFAKIIACIRIAVPYTGMIISTRESEAVRGKVLDYGISQISGASRTSVGGYTEAERPHDSEQFDVSDQRTLDEVVRWLMELDHIPSFCTACYREGRTGDRFMSLCKSGQILNCCHPNALMTLTEYLVDYASEETKKVGFGLIERELEKIPKEKVREIARKNIEDIKNSNHRDFRF